jgi:hypothetical protein
LKWYVIILLIIYIKSHHDDYSEKIFWTRYNIFLWQKFFCHFLVYYITLLLSYIFMTFWSLLFLLITCWITSSHLHIVTLSHLHYVRSYSFDVIFYFWTRHYQGYVFQLTQIWRNYSLFINRHCGETIQRVSTDTDMDWLFNGFQLTLIWTDYSTGFNWHWYGLTIQRVCYGIELVIITNNCNQHTYFIILSLFNFFLYFITILHTPFFHYLTFFIILSLFYIHHFITGFSLYFSRFSSCHN